MKRLFNLDYLRGLAAFGIMLYHYTLWTKGLQSSADFLGRVGVYGVAIFYILSGLTLSYVYSDRLKFTAADLWDFAKKRIFRILPLLWLVTAYSIYINQLNPGFWDLTFNLIRLTDVFYPLNYLFYPWIQVFSDVLLLTDIKTVSHKHMDSITNMSITKLQYTRSILAIASWVSYPLYGPTEAMFP